MIFAPTYRDISTFFMHAQQMEKAGVPLRQMLQAAAQDSGHKALTRAAWWMEHDVAAGKTLAEAMAQHPRIFNQTLVGLVAAGEETGRLALVLGKCFDHCVQMDMHQRNMRRATRHFKFSAIVILALMLIMGHNAGPVMTAFLAMVLAGLVAAYHFVPAFRQFCEYLFIITPRLGTFIRRLEMARFCEMLALYYDAGIPMRKALPAAAHAVQNHSLREVVIKAAQQVIDGESFQDAFRRIPQVESTFLAMIAAGEKSGNFGATLHEASLYYRAEMDDALDALQKILPPVLTAILGVVIYTSF